MCILREKQNVILTISETQNLKTFRQHVLFSHTCMVAAHTFCKCVCTHSSDDFIFRLTFFNCLTLLQCSKHQSCVCKKVFLSLFCIAGELMRVEYAIIMFILSFVLPLMSLSALLIDHSVKDMQRLLCLLFQSYIYIYI